MQHETQIAKLKQAFGAGHVVTILGTGVSVAACGNQEIEGQKVATWPGLLHHGVAHCKEKGVADDGAVNLLSLQIESGELDFLIAAAEVISQRLQAKSSGVYRGWLKATIGELKAADPAILHALGALPGVLATLNYDKLIEDATDRRPVTWLETDKIQDMLQGREANTVLHLHGYYEDPKSVVLGLQSYLKVKEHAHAKAVLELFTIGHTLLFVGCGDTVLDPNFARLIEWGKTAHVDVTPRHFLLCRESEVAAFQAKLSDAPWLQPLAYGEDYNGLLPFLQQFRPANGVVPTLPLPVVPSLDLARYRQTINHLYNRIKLEDIVVNQDNIRPLTLTGMFIAQNAKECAEFMPSIYELPKEAQQHLRASGKLDGPHLDDETLERYQRAYLNQSARPVLDILRDPNCTRLVILGDPGSGKSTLLQYLLLDWTQPNVADPIQASLPLLIELREYARLRSQGQVSDFLDYLCKGASLRFHFERTALDVGLKQAPCRVLFDGLDEIFDATLRREIITAIHRFADVYPQARIVVTSRIVGYQHQIWGDEKFRHFMLQDLDPEQIENFLTLWHASAYEDPVKGDTRRARFARAIADLPAIRQLAGNPLLLTMMAIINRTQDLPHDRAELYDQCARLLLQQWEADMTPHSAPGQPMITLDFKAKRRLLLRVAGIMQSGPSGLAGNLIDEELLEQTLAAGLETMSGVSPDSAARLLIEQLRGRNFMLCSVGSHSYAFVHRTFLEYFCSLDILERFEKTRSLSQEALKTEIFGHWRDETWHEVLRLLISMIGEIHVEEILAWLLEQEDPQKNCRPQLLAIECVGEVRMRTKLGAVEQRSMETAKKLARFAPSTNNDPNEKENKTVVQIRRRAINLLATIWPDVQDNYAWFKAYVISNDKESDSGRGAAVFALSRAWKGASDILFFLKKCVQENGDWHVRTNAILALCRDWTDDLETLHIVQNRAQFDDDDVVSLISTNQLLEHWKDNLDTLRIMKINARSHPATIVRTFAMGALIASWKNEPDTVQILKHSAQFDPDKVIRAKVVEQLGEYWATDSNVQNFLKEFKKQSRPLKKQRSKNVKIK